MRDEAVEQEWAQKLGTAFKGAVLMPLRQNTETAPATPYTDRQPDAEEEPNDTTEAKKMVRLLSNFRHSEGEADGMDD